MTYKGDVFKRYIRCYEKIALDDLEDPIEKGKEYRHNELIKFIGNVYHFKILDVGSSQGLFLDKIKAKFKVAFDISFSYLKEIDKNKMLPVLGKAEFLPFKESSLDVIICSDVLEHVLYPEMAIIEFHRVLKNKGKLYIVVPWKEDLTSYEIYKDIYEFTHLRTFDRDVIFSLLSNWKINRLKGMIAKNILLPKYLINIPGLNKIINILIPSWIRLRLYPGPVHMMIEAEKVE